MSTPDPMPADAPRTTPARVDALSEEAYVLGEGARTTGDGGLLFVDLLAGRLLAHSGDPRDEVRPVLRLEQPLGAVAPVAGRDQEFLAATGAGLALLGGDGSLHWLARPETGAGTAMRVNDGVCDGQGRFWFSTTPYDETPVGSLYSCDVDGTVRRVLGDLAIANGPAVSADGRHLFLADSGPGTITRYALAPDGTLDDGVLIVHERSDASPDGMTTDAEGTLWVAMFGGAEVRRYAADGTLLLRVALPAEQPTSVALVPGGGLYVTTATKGMTVPGPLDGRLLRVTLDGSEQPSTPVPWRSFTAGPTVGSGVVGG